MPFSLSFKVDCMKEKRKSPSGQSVYAGYVGKCRTVQKPLSLQEKLFKKRTPTSCLLLDVIKTEVKTEANKRSLIYNEVLKL